METQLGTKLAQLLLDMGRNSEGAILELQHKKRVRKTEIS